MENPSQEKQSKRCRPCERLTHPLSAKDIQKRLDASPEWQLSEDGKKIYRKYVMKSFLSAFRFMNDVAQLAEKENHHPDIHLTDYRHLRIDLSTHAVDGLSENDFILAQQISQLHPELKS